MRRATIDRDQDPNGSLVDVAGLVYGLEVRGRLPASFRPYLVTGAGKPADSAGPLDVEYRRLDDLHEVEAIWVSEPSGPGAGNRIALFRLPGGFGLTISEDGRGLFRCVHRTVTIEWAGRDTGAPHAFFSYALPLWLEADGVPLLHASAITVGGRAIAFLGRSGMGKSVLCAELLRLGCGFLADDGLALRRDAGGEWRCFHGPPLLRLWPSGLEGRLEIAAHSLPKVHETVEKRQLRLSGDSAREAAAGLGLEAVYVLERRPEADGPVRISAFSRLDALIHLIAHGVAAAPAAALGLSGPRLELLADFVDKVPVQLLSFPSSTDSAVRIQEAIHLLPRSGR